ncbi:MAG: hypothetical protein HYR63_26865 [Proteobacteria bacterium]|nr:hypothetical protein [Pseudomonadota bacterium]MBI3498846.1 hypothetical protein [Pseudomonadota bacterium]
MPKTRTAGSAPTFEEVLDLAKGRRIAAEAPKSATVTLARLLARAHREDDPGKRPILVQFPAKRVQ